ncbi:transmembrane channel-like protein 3 isoform X1 [Haliotis rufescens]|uniref:transmembrane channel-like protein 3 isoform X1 n=1 Tax=Haliotis rufescens TaxID=6454 RepID=UPI00201EA48F|nr:transmembrane channel-like protein 3 isoform X1 [Haliotis rufescens]
MNNIQPEPYLGHGARQHPRRGRDPFFVGDVPDYRVLQHQHQHPQTTGIRVKYKSSIFSGYKECVLKPLKRQVLHQRAQQRDIAENNKLLNGELQGDGLSPTSFIGTAEKVNTHMHNQNLKTNQNKSRHLAVYEDNEIGDEEEDFFDSTSNYQRSSNARRRSIARKRRRKSSAFQLNEEELMQVYTDSKKAVTEEELLENLQTQKDIIDNVKLQPWGMSKKMKMLGLAQAYVEKFEGKLSRSQGYQQKWRTFFRQLNRNWNNLVAMLVPWEMRIKRIESHFGSVVASYFVFLRWLIWINIWLTFLPLCFVIIPELIVGAPHGNMTRKTVPADEEANSADLKTIWDAEGILKYSVVFYGYYGNTGAIGSGYRLPLAYLLTCFMSFALSFIFVLKTMASNSRQSRMSTKDEHFTFSWKLFTEWDYMIGNKETANTKHASLVTTMREAILEEEEKTKEGNKHLLLFLRVLANVLVLMSLALSAYIIQLFVDRSRRMELSKRQDKNFVAGFWAENELTVIMTLISTLFPNISDLISMMEKYHPRINLRLQLARIFALNLLNLYTLFIALYNKQADLKKEIQSERVALLASLGNDTILCSDISTTVPTVSESPVGRQNCTVLEETSHLCWETMIGQEVFKLTVMDLIFTMGQIVIIDFIRGVFIRYCNNICCWDMEKKFPEYPDFKTAENLLHLINNQGVIWLGTFFAPGLPVLNMFKLMILVYVRCWSVMVCNVPQERIFRASRSNNFYYALLLVMLFLCMLPPLFAIVGVEPSPRCGPFSGMGAMYEVLTDAMQSGLPSWVNSILKYAASPAIIIPVFLLLLMTIYYLVSVGRSLRESNNDLRNQLEYERTDGRRKVYAMADAKHDTEGDGVIQRKGPAVAPKPRAKKKDMTNAVSSVLTAARLAKMMSGGADPPKVITASPSPDQHKIPVAVVHGKKSVKERASKEILLRDAVHRQEHQLAKYNQGYDPAGDDEGTQLAQDDLTNGLLKMLVTKSKMKRPHGRRSHTNTVQQNIEVEESSDDPEVTLRSSQESRTKSAEKLVPNRKRSKNVLAQPQERRSRSSSKEGRARKSKNTSVEIVNETVQAEVNVCPPSNVKKSSSQTNVRQSRSEDNVKLSNSRNNLSSKRSVTKAIPKITVEDCSDDNTDSKRLVGEDSSDSESSSSSQDNSINQDNLNLSFASDNMSDSRSPEIDTSRQKFASLLSFFKESESDGGSSDDQNSPDAIAARRRFASAFTQFSKR